MVRGFDHNLSPKALKGRNIPAQAASLGGGVGS